MSLLDACTEDGCNRPRTCQSIFCDQHHREQLDRANGEMKSTDPRETGKLDFMFNGMPVGYFEEPQYAYKDGDYRYMPYRGWGHYQLGMALGVGQPAECYYEAPD